MRPLVRQDVTVPLGCQDVCMCAYASGQCAEPDIPKNADVRRVASSVGNYARRMDKTVWVPSAIRLFDVAPCPLASAPVSCATAVHTERRSPYSMRFPTPGRNPRGILLRHLFPTISGAPARPSHQHLCENSYRSPA